jgi:arylsulfatase A
LWEGGIRVPTIVKGPGIEAGSVSDVPVISMDFFSTMAALAGASGPQPDGVEGASLLPILMNGGQLPEGTRNLVRQYAPGGALYFHFPHYVSTNAPRSAIRDGDFKLVKVDGENGRPDKIYLFNLADNITESSLLNSPLNLADDMPAKADELLAKLENWLQSVDASLPYVVSAPTELRWNAGNPGHDPNGTTGVCIRTYVDRSAADVRAPWARQHSRAKC